MAEQTSVVETLIGAQSTGDDVIAKFGVDLSGKNIVVTGASSGEA